MTAPRREDAGAPPVFSDAMRAYYKEVESFQKAHARRHKRRSVLLSGVALIEAIIICGLGYAVAALAPTVRIVPVFLWARPDGTVENAVTPSSLPATLNEAQQREALWQYVRLREGYSQTEEQYAYTVVSALSSADVRQRYQRSRNAQYADAPINKIGGRGVIRVAFVSGTWIGPQRYLIRFDRSVEMGGAPPVVTRMVAPIGFTTDVTVAATDRITFNAAGIVVTEYPGAEAEGVQ